MLVIWIPRGLEDDRVLIDDKSMSCVACCLLCVHDVWKYPGRVFIKPVSSFDSVDIFLLVSLVLLLLPIHSTLYIVIWWMFPFVYIS
jgi:hypothetical protein